MYNEVNIGGVYALAGVVLGFILSEVYGGYKKHKERMDSKHSLLDEVFFNHEQTKNKIDILNQAISALNREKFIPTKCPNYSTIEFLNLYHVALPKLTILQRDNLRYLNSFYLNINKLLDGFDDSFKTILIMQRKDRILWNPCIKRLPFN